MIKYKKILEKHRVICYSVTTNQQGGKVMSFNRILFDKPAKVGETLFFKDPDPSGVSGWKKVTSVPDIENDEDFQSYSDKEKEEIYLDQIIILNEGTEVFAGELFRGS